MHSTAYNNVSSLPINFCFRCCCCCLFVAIFAAVNVVVVVVVVFTVVDLHVVHTCCSCTECDNDVLFFVVTWF